MPHLDTTIGAASEISMSWHPALRPEDSQATDSKHGRLPLNPEQLTVSSSILRDSVAASEQDRSIAQNEMLEDDEHRLRDLTTTDTVYAETAVSEFQIECSDGEEEEEEEEAIVPDSQPRHLGFDREKAEFCESSGRDLLGMEQSHERTHETNETRQREGLGLHARGDETVKPVNFWEDVPENDDPGEGDFFDRLNTQTKPIYNPPEADSRFEEGMHLLGDNIEGSSETDVDTGAHIDNLFETEDDEEASFFSSIHKHSTEDRPQSSGLTRKSTGEASGLLDYTSRSPARRVSSADSVTSAVRRNGSKELSTQEDLATRWEAELNDDETTTSGMQIAHETNWTKLDLQEDLAARWQAELDGDDDLLLEDEIAYSPVGESDQLPPVVGASSGTIHPSEFNESSEMMRSSLNPPTRANAYTLHQPSTSEIVQDFHIQGAPSSSAQSGFAPQSEQGFSEDGQESFVNKNEGYKSPYDLPPDLTRPRRPASTRKSAVPQPSGVPPPPPRSSSMPVSFQADTAASKPKSTDITAKPSVPSQNFYEELPLPSRSRPGSSNRYAPQSGSSTFWPPPPVSGTSSIAVPTAPVQRDLASAGSSLQPPEPLDPYTAQLPSIVPPVPNMASRYSPKPPWLQTAAKQSPSPRYSPAPPARNRYVSQSAIAHSTTSPFQPRTSSPLAQHEQIASETEADSRPEAVLTSSVTPQALDHGTVPTSVGLPRQVSDSAAISKNLSQPHTPPPQNSYASHSQHASPAQSRYAPTDQQTLPLRNQYASPEYINEFSKRIAPSTLSHYQASTSTMGANVQYFSSAGETVFAPPRRSQSQSPVMQGAGPRASSIPLAEYTQLPASAQVPTSPNTVVNPYAGCQLSSHVRHISEKSELIPPTDGQQFDPLERWKGAPVFKFGFGGVALSCFPKYIPRYSAGQLTPMIKPSLGEVKTDQLSNLFSPLGTIVSHPGPLKSKSKKKDLLSWLSSKIVALENEESPRLAALDSDSRKRFMEKIMLWKIVRLLVEHDGLIEGSADIQKSVLEVLRPDLQASEAPPAYENDYSGPTSSAPFSTHSLPDAIKPQSLETIQNNLLAGDREKAVWDAADRRLWGHAMLMASTLEKTIWKQLVQEFVRREVKTAGGNTESLAALYQIFAGNIEESIDELVPPSARAGLQMVSKVNAPRPAKNALDGLDRWQDTLALALSNRTPEDSHALVALGKLLYSYGRTDAAHICYIFSRAPVFGGPEDPQAAIVLLGIDHHRLPNSLVDQDAFLLTEAYEYATTVLSGSTASFPYLVSFKFLHAFSLADCGRISQAQSYCDAITAAPKATTKPSGYYSHYLFSAVDELSARLKQTTSDGASSWISRPTMEKVSGSMWAKFNSFVAGEDSDPASTGSGRVGDGEIGAFANVTGTPTISRPPSGSDLYGSYLGSQSLPTVPSSRYHPGSQNASHSSPEQPRGKSSFDSQRSPSLSQPFAPRRGSQEPLTPLDSNSFSAGAIYSPSQSIVYYPTPLQSSYVPLAPVEEDTPLPSQQGAPASMSQPATLQQRYYESVMQLTVAADTNNDSVLQPEAVGYQPPVGVNTFESPSYENEGTSSADSEAEFSEEPAEKKSSFIDDDDDNLAARAASLQKEEKARKDREADEAFRKAAEEDAKRPPKPAKKGWFGWFGGKKESDSAGSGPIRAKLGEKNQFYYDKELKKWVNAKDPDSATSMRSTPPPPKASASPSRTTSEPPTKAPSPMPSGTNGSPPSAVGALPPISVSPASSLGAALPAGSVPPRYVSSSVLTPPGGNAVPSRPSSSLSQATSIDDLLGAPQIRKGPATKGKKKGRGYVDVMAK